ncbi:hypothetical protein LCGC14_1477790, partial [marine sediment metagenome]
RIYRPLPIDHPRVQSWIANTCRHSAHCYRDEGRPEYGRPGMLIFPVPHYKLKSFSDDDRWSNEYRKAARALANAFNQQETARAEGIAVLENHQAVLRIRKVYPDWAPETTADGRAPLTPNVGEDGPSNWWERDAVRPSAEECTPDRWYGKHRTDYCQYCGRRGGSS